MEGLAEELTKETFRASTRGSLRTLSTKVVSCPVFLYNRPGSIFFSMVDNFAKPAFTSTPWT